MAEGFVVQDIDREGLVEHFAIEAEAKSLREWVAKSDAPRSSGFDARLALAKKRRKEGNRARVRKIRALWRRHKNCGYSLLQYGRWAMAVWLYLAALQAIDYSKKDRVVDGIEDSSSKAQQWQEEVMTIMSNMSAAFSAKDVRPTSLHKPQPCPQDNYNSIRSADLGLAFADKLRTARDDRRTIRAKLLYRRGISRARREGDDAAQAADDVAKAVELDGGADKTMLNALRRLKAVAKRQKAGFSEMKGVFNNAPSAPNPKDLGSPLPKEPNIAERRADRRKFSRRVKRWAKAIAARLPLKTERLSRAVVLAFAAVAIWLALPSSKSLQNAPHETWRFRLVIGGLVVARIVEFTIKHFRKRRQSHLHPLMTRAAPSS